MSEIWKDIEGYEGIYQVSNLGRIKRLEGCYYCGHRNEQNKHIQEQIMKPYQDKKGYLHIALSNGNERKHYMVHRLVANAFIPNPNNLQFINHKSEIKTENFVENLEWCDAKYNNNYGSRLEKIANKHKGKPLTEEHKQKISIANSGSNNCMYGKPSWNRGQKGLQVAWNKGVPCSEETKSKISQAKKKLAS